MTTLLAIDPCGIGGTTGIVLLGYGEDEPARLLNSWNPGTEGTYDWFYRRMFDRMVQPDVVVCEKYVNRNIPGADINPVRVEGAVHIFGRFLGRKIEWRTPQQRLFVRDENLHKLGLLFEKVEDHHHDRREAARHGVSYLVERAHHKPTYEKGWH